MELMSVSRMYLPHFTTYSHLWCNSVLDDEKDVRELIHNIGKSILTV
jgi:hypothetical protein